MGRQSDKSNTTGTPEKQAPAAPEQAASLHVFTPTDGDAPEPTAVLPVAPQAPSEVVAGFAGHVPDATRERCTLYLSPEINAQLNLVAHVERKERSQIVEALLRQHLTRYRVERA